MGRVFWLWVGCLVFVILALGVIGAVLGQVISRG